MVWNDFQGVIGTFPEDEDFSTLSADDTGARIFTYIDWTVWWDKSNNTPCEYEITKLDVVASTSKTESWFHPDRIEGEEDEILEHEQGHFDIAQIHAQEFKVGYEGKTFACPSGVYDNDEIFNDIDGFWLKIDDDWGAMDKTYDKETEHHADRKAQAEWDEKIISLLSTGGHVKEVSIPAWIKNNAGWWADGQIDDSSFLQGISYLIQNSIIVVPTTESGAGGGEVPEWVKNTAGWWANGTIDDGTFVNAIQYLIQQGLIQV